MQSNDTVGNRRRINRYRYRYNDARGKSYVTNEGTKGDDECVCVCVWLVDRGARREGNAACTVFGSGRGLVVVTDTGIRGG